MKWVTRAGARLDRPAMVWLIRRYIDPDAEILFARGEDVVSLAKQLGAMPFHHPDVELRHTGVRTGFDSLLFKYKLIDKDPALGLMALVIRGGETGDKNLTPYSAGVKAISNGIRLKTTDDQEIVEAHMPILDALYEFCRAQLRPVEGPASG